MSKLYEKYRSIYIIFVIFFVVVLVWVISNPLNKSFVLEHIGITSISKKEHEVIRSTILQHHQLIGKNTDEKYYAESHEIFDKKTKDQNVTYYLFEYHQAYQYKDGSLNPILPSNSNSSVIALTFVVKDDQMILQEYWTPLEGNLYKSSIQDKFPDSIEEEVFSFDQKQLQNECLKQAKQHFNEK